MEVGVCCSLENAHLAAGMGFDYVELSASEMAAAEPWNPSVYDGLKVRALNLFLPPDLLFFAYEGQFENSRIVDYFERVNARRKEIGVEVVVIGGGRQRSVPSRDLKFLREFLNVPRLEECDSVEEFFSCLVMIATGVMWSREIAGVDLEFEASDSEHQRKQLRLESRQFAAEALNRTETNVGVKSGPLAQAMAKYGLPYTADAYHILKEWDFDGRQGGLSAPSEEHWAAQLPFAPVHAHIADLPDRLAPKANDLMLTGFFRRLKELGYEGRVSLEVRTPFDELVGAADRVRELIQSV